MLRRPFGCSVLEAPLLGFGAMQVGDPSLPEDAAARLLNHALDIGLTLVDTARSYGLSEERIGRHLARRRDEFVLCTKVGYGVDGVPDWTYACVVAGVDAARARLRTDVIDVVQLHSCGLDRLEEGEVARALADCAARGWLRIAGYSGDGAALRWAVASGEFGAVQASVSLCDQQALPALAEARACGIGTIAKRPLCGQPWSRSVPPADEVHADYWRRFAALRGEFGFDTDDWESLALRFAAGAPGVDCVIVGGADPRHLERNAAAVAAGPIAQSQRDAIAAAFARVGADWQGRV